MYAANIPKMGAGVRKIHAASLRWRMARSDAAMGRDARTARPANLSQSPPPRREVSTIIPRRPSNTILRPTPNTRASQLRAFFMAGVPALQVNPVEYWKGLYFL